MNGLSVEMNQQKNKLKERLKNMKSRKQSELDSKSQRNMNDWDKEEIQQEQEHLQRLEENYDKLMGMLNNAPSEDLQKIGLARLKDLLEQPHIDGEQLITQVLSPNCFVLTSLHLVLLSRTIMICSYVT